MVLFSVILLAWLIHVLNSPRFSIPKDDLIIQTFRSGSGWGYEILAGQELLIKQSFIPAVSGFKSFETEQQAIQAAQLVIKKIKKGTIPSLSRDDLDSLGIYIE